jgi:hypothetical protein
MIKKEVNKIKYVRIPSVNPDETIYLKENEIITKIFVEPLFFPTTTPFAIYLNGIPTIVFNVNLQNFAPFVYEIKIKENIITFKSTNEYFILLEITTLEEKCK